ncbi:hypothetical protein Q3G72_031546 [Acer saccharum]|nr:hypothetical protein Q3G72_031546 [Acer saccharum]
MSSHPTSLSTTSLNRLSSSSSAVTISLDHVSPCVWSSPSLILYRYITWPSISLPPLSATSNPVKGKKVVLCCCLNPENSLDLHMFSIVDPTLANCYVQCGKFEDVLLLLIVVLFVHAKYLFMTWVVAAAAVAAYMAKFWQNLSRDRNSSLSVLSVGKVISVEWLVGEKTKLVGTFPPKKRG